MDPDLSQAVSEPAATETDPLTTRLVAHLATLQPGTKLPSERVLAEQLGVSRTALRDRFSRLESMGVLERRTGSGTYVQGLSSATTSQSLALSVAASNLDSISMIPVRHALEREAARLAALNNDHLNIAKMAISLDLMKSSNSDQALQEADYDFHDALFAASGSPGLEFFAGVLRGVLRSTIQRLHLSSDKANQRAVHGAIHAAIVAKDPAAAMIAIDRHFVWLDELLRNATDLKT